MSISTVGLTLLATAVALVWLAAVAWRRRASTRGARSFTFFMLAAAVWALFEALQASDPDPLRALTWRQIKYVGIATLPVAYVVFAHDYTRGASWLNRYSVALLLLVAATTVGLTWTNELHGLMWLTGSGAPAEPLLSVAGSGAWFWVHTAVSYALIALASFYLLRGYLGIPRSYRSQVVWVLIAVAIPWLANVVVIFGGLDSGGVDVTPLTFGLSAFAFARSLFSHRLLDIVPVAQEAVMHSLGDPVIVTDQRGRVLQLNPSAQRLFELPGGDAAIGEPLSSFLGDAPELAAALTAEGEQRLAVVFRPAGRALHYEAHVTSLRDRRGRITGRSLRLQDIARQVEAERMLGLAETTMRQQESYVLALQEVTEGLMRRAPLGELLDAVMRHAGDVMAAPHGFLDLIDADAGVTVRERARGGFAGVEGARARPGEGLAGKVWAARAPLRIADYAHWEGRLHRAGLDWVRAAVGAPLSSREGVHGVLVVARERADRRPFDGADEAALSRFAELAALAVLNVRTIDELEARRFESEQLARLGTALQESGDIHERMAVVLRAIPRVVGLERAVIWLPSASGDALDASAWVGFDAEVSGVRVPLDGSVPLLQEAFRSARETIVGQHDLLASTLRARSPYAQHPLLRSRSLITLPLIARNAVVGVLAADTPRDGRSLEGALELLRRIASNAALAIDAAMLLAASQAEVAERRAAEAELRRSEEKYRGILEQIEEAYFEADLRGRFTLANPALLRAVGLAREALIGRSFRHLVARDDVRGVMECFAEVARTGRPLSGVELRYRGVDGGEQRAELSVTLVRDAAGAAAGFRGVLRDIEERMRQQEELQAAKDGAEAANAAKSVFLANVSHELRTPLTSILGFARLIERRFDALIAPQLAGVDDPKLQRAVQQVRENAGIIGRESRRLTTLINDVLDLSKIEAGQVDWRMERLQLRDVVEQALEATRGLLDGAAGVRIETVLDDVPDVIGDRDRLVQVVINLISNAVKFTPAGVVAVRLEASGADPRISVRDTGVGIAPEDHDTVFEQFRQVGDTLTEKPQGTGLGLPICKQIVEHHGGRLWLESALGAGSTFAFTLPAIGPLASASAPRRSEPSRATLAASVRLRRHVERVLAGIDASTPSTRAAAGADVTPAEADAGDEAADGRATVLVVDDDARLRGLLRQVFEEAGYRVIEAADGVTALERVRERRPDLVTLDVMMPQLSGFDVAAALKNDPDTHAIPIVILSVVEDAERGYRLGVERYLTKPVDVGALVADVDALLTPEPDLVDGPVGAVDTHVVLIEDPDGDARQRSLLARTEAALTSSGYRVARAATVDAAAALEPRPAVVVLSRAVAEGERGLTRLRGEPRLRDAVVVCA